MSDDFAELTIGMLPRRAAQRWGAREALVFQDSRWTFAEFDAEVERAAKGLMAIGVGAGDKVGLWFTNRPEYLFLFFAVSRIGAIAVPLNTRYRTNDISYAVRQSNCRVLIFAEQSGPVDYLEMVEDILGDVAVVPNGLRSDRLPDLKRVIVLGPCTRNWAQPWPDVLAAGEQTASAAVTARCGEVKPRDTAMIVYTSGTTGEAKGVMLNHVGIGRSTVRSLIWGTTFRDIQINYLPMFHLYAIGFVTIPSLALGACQILTEAFDAEQAIDLIEQERVTIIHGFDPHYRELLEVQARRPRDLSSLRMGSFPSGPDNCIPIVRAAHEKLCPIVASFGLTESWGGTTATFLDGSVEQRCVASGFPLPDVEIKVVDPETRQEQPRDTEGEILIRSASLMLGYYGKPEETAAAIDADGWLHTGDAGHLREDGYIRFTGRYKDMLKVGGENVSPAEVEQLLLELPGVREVAVVAYPDARLHEVAAAFIVSDGNAPNIQAVEAHCRGKIASFKIPRHVFLADELPMTPSGKVQKGKLRELTQQHADGAAQAGSAGRG